MGYRMGYAEVSVNSPVARRRTFSYAIPSGMEIEVGQAVWVPFGDKQLQGVVLELSRHPAVAETREIAGVIDPRPLLSPARLALARWISSYYLSSLFDAVSLMLPPGFGRRAVTFIDYLPAASGRDLSSLTPDQQDILEMVRGLGRVSLKAVEKRLGQKRASAVVSQLVGWSLVARSYELEPVKIRPKQELYLSLSVPPEDIQPELTALLKRRATKQAALLDFLSRQPGPVGWTEVSRQTGTGRVVAKALANKGLVRLEEVEVRRDPLASRDIAPDSPLALTDTQQSALEAINQAPAGSVCLLHGVTGSGKTEVYLQALAEVVRRGRRGIVLVPEISLTPQTIDRFAARFPQRVAVLHSQLSLGEQFDEWRRIREGEFDVVIGPRSAVFAPQPDLGLIVIDEEHEWTYKQADKSPRYHARDVALKLAELTGAVVVLGSATPDVETFYRAGRGDYRLLELPQRVTTEAGSPLPEVEVVDLRQELKAGNRGIFSRSLSAAVARAVTDRGQVILFLNRRGAATFVQCRNCGFVLCCRRCDVPLSHHFSEDTLVCHQCNYRTPLPQTCPRCRSPRIKLLGIGTQKLEQEAGFAFPQARLLRWDSDATRGRDSHQEILDRFRTRKADILIGTQMVAKGLDLPSVTLVGVVNADTGLNLPDFRAGERTFQLLSQVAGRAGRGPRGGKVIIQTYTPEHYAIQAAARQDYSLFYEKEIAYRRRLRQPPFTRLAALTYSHTNDARCRSEAEGMKRRLVAEMETRGTAGISLIGPAPAFIRRRRGRFRWQIVLRGPGLSAFLSAVTMPQGWVVDIDPVGLF